MGTNNSNKLPAVIAATKHSEDIPGDIDIVNDARKTLEAVKLIQLGARATLVCQLTGLTKKMVGRLYPRLTGMPSPPGQVPFTDTWYLKNNQRMLDANLVWRLFHQLDHAERSVSSVLIHVYEAYLEITDGPVLSLTRAFFVPRLVTMHIWHEQSCDHCSMPFIAPGEHDGATCPVCIEYFNHRCRCCGTAIRHRTSGRRKAVCSDCYEDHRKGRKQLIQGTANGCPWN